MLLRSAVVHSQATRLLREVYERQLIGALRPVVDRTELRHRAGLVASQLLGVALCRYVFGLPGLGDRSIDGLITDVAPTIQRYLTGRLPSREPE